MKLNKNSISIFMLFCLLVFHVSLQAQYVLKNSVFNSGSAVNTDSATYNLYSLTGQDLVGKAGNETYRANSGFLYQTGYLITAIEDPFSDLPITFELFQNYPNPFNPSTHIKFALPAAAKVKIDVFNILGQQVATLINADKAAGYHIINFEAQRFSSGLYFYTIQANDFYKVKKMMLVK